MNRRGFLKSIGKVVAGCAIVPSVAKAVPKVKSYPIGASTGIDPNSEWAKQKPLSLEQLNLGCKEFRDAFKKDYYVVYDFQTNEQTLIEDDKILNRKVFEMCPYAFSGEVQKDIDSGKITYTIQKRSRLV